MVTKGTHNQPEKDCAKSCLETQKNIFSTRILYLNIFTPECPVGWVGWSSSCNCPPIFVLLYFSSYICPPTFFLLYFSPYIFTSECLVGWVRWSSLLIFIFSYLFTSECPVGWVGWSSSCYRHLPSPSTWPAAQAICLALGDIFIYLYLYLCLYLHLDFYSYLTSPPPLPINMTCFTGTLYSF